VPYQLKALGVGDVATLLPWGQDNDCKELVAGLADVVFGVAAPAPAESRRQLLGIRIELKDAAVHVVEVQKGSVAAAADLRTGDVITEIAGQPVKRNTDVIAAVQRQAPGTWLPLRIKRNDEPMEIIAKFPPLEP
jgi:S1-C subfamily serine protease